MSTLANRINTTLLNIASYRNLLEHRASTVARNSTLSGLYDSYEADTKEVEEQLLEDLISCYKRAVDKLESLKTQSNNTPPIQGT